MLKALPPIDIAKLQEPWFSHGEALRITGLTADTLLTWHKRGVVPNIAEREQTGRGHRRRYCILDLLYLAVVKEFAGKMPLVVAGLAAMQAVRAIIATYDMIRFAESAEDVSEIPGISFVAYENETGQTKFDVFTEQDGPGVRKWPGGGIQGWMRSQNIRAATVIDITTLTLELFAKIGDVLREQEQREQSKRKYQK